MKLSIPVIRTDENHARNLLDALRDKLSPQGDIVSEAGRARTLELFGEALSPRQVVARICQDVREYGLKSLLEYTRKLDQKDYLEAEFRVRPEEFEQAHQRVGSAYLETIRRIQANIQEFQSATLPTHVQIVREIPCENATSHPGRIELQMRSLPLRRVGICVPGGAAAYPSTLLMTAIPAQTAGVQEIAVVVPPTPYGGYNDDLLAACYEIGVKEVYRVGGAQAVAALAYGVEGLHRVDKIVGPGNLFVALAKQYVFGDVDIDSIAGPSEVVVLADDSAHADFVASDLISQAEHSPGSAVLITWSEQLISEVIEQLEIQLARLERGALALQSLNDYSALILARDEQEAIQLTEELAPEHLHISTKDPNAQLGDIQNAGAIFLGHYTPVALGDYVAGPSHVLPTGGTARFANGLSATDFLKQSSIIAYNKEGLEHDADDVRLMADKEGLTAHRASVDIRLKKSEG